MTVAAMACQDTFLNPSLEGWYFVWGQHDSRNSCRSTGCVYRLAESLTGIPHDPDTVLSGTLSPRATSTKSGMPVAVSLELMACHVAPAFVPQAQTMRCQHNNSR